MYNACLNGCRYCYANYNANIVKRNFAQHDPKSPLIFGQLTDKDIIRERAVKSYRDLQLKIFLGMLYKDGNECIQMVNRMTSKMMVFL